MMNMESTKTGHTDYLLNLGINQFSAVDFPNAIKTLETVAGNFLREKKYKQYLQCQNFLIVMHTEMENFDEINRIRYELADIIWNHKNLGINYALFHYALGFCFLRQRDYIKAQVQFDQGLAQAFKWQKKSEEQQDQQGLLISKINTCYISYSFTVLYTVRNQIPEAVEELKNMAMLLEQFQSLYMELSNQATGSTRELNDDIFQLLEKSREDQQTLEFAYNLLRAYILKVEKKYDSAEELYWFCYEQSQKNYRRRYMSLYLLYFLGKNYIDTEDYEQASIFLNLAKKSTNPDVFKKINREINKAIEQLKQAMTNNYDIVVNFENNIIMEKQRGYINIKNQFILLDMLKLFISNPGMVHSKESLVEKVWKQKYDPRVHDNKIYVTIKRLRELVEPDHKKPIYIFRTKTGYFINKNKRVKVISK